MSYVPSTIKKFAKERGAEVLVNKVARWVESVGKWISGGTAIGKNYSTLILDIRYQGSEIYINLENGQVELYGEPVNTLQQFKQVFEANQN